MPKRKSAWRERWLQQLREAVEWGRDGNKSVRERWVVNQFLANLGVTAAARSIESSLDEPPDVIFQSARFEITESFEPGRRQQQEFKDALRRAEAGDYGGAVSDIDVEDIEPLALGALVRDAGHKKTYAPAVKAGLDLLVYTNLGQRILVRAPMPDPGAFADMGWRSVSALNCGASLVYFAAPDAPAFLREKSAQLTGEIW